MLVENHAGADLVITSAQLALAPDLEVAAVPARCDSHALAEDKAGTRLPLEVGTAATRNGQLRLEPPAKFTAAVYGFVRSACAGGG